ncbi:unnamed protein product [Ambrosiozyma monospora]|uniref:Unnamed protein product n=1 Tax=Ambrosiozyma monospora TaxID=43982 RepID=A0ACB5TTB5_AMBMO|nr:unnamed protein product [Ambrosiozyma monospora]
MITTSVRKFKAKVNTSIINITSESPYSLVSITQLSTLLKETNALCNADILKYHKSFIESSKLEVVLHVFNELFNQLKNGSEKSISYDKLFYKPTHTWTLTTFVPGVLYHVVDFFDYSKHPSPSRLHISPHHLLITWVLSKIHF